jgi:prolyl-tRNA editing enzyme YbaK/EbsC (Cys-tRNA(Pro) deacylase)
METNLSLGKLKVVPAVQCLDLVAFRTAELISGGFGAGEIGVAEIDPSFSDTAAFCEYYQVEPGCSANCVVLEAKRADRSWFAACLILATTRADVNNLARRTLDARRVSFASMDAAVAETQMEYGGITPIGLPADWPILIDKAVVDTELVLIGGGIRKSKLVLPGRLLANLPNAQVLEGLGRSLEIPMQSP